MAVNHLYNIMSLITSVNKIFMYDFLFVESFPTKFNNKGNYADS